jgi:hypothetical protein
MFRAVIHPLSDQPLVVDIEEMPTAADNALVCFNVRTIDGKRPKFIDRSDSTFIFPYASIRFVEVYSGVDAGLAEPERAEPAEPDELEIDEDFLRRVREA